MKITVWAREKQGSGLRAGRSLRRPYSRNPELFKSSSCEADHCCRAATIQSTAAVGGSSAVCWTKTLRASLPNNLFEHSLLREAEEKRKAGAIEARFQTWQR